MTATRSTDFCRMQATLICTRPFSAIDDVRWRKTPDQRGALTWRRSVGGRRARTIWAVTKGRILQAASEATSNTAAENGEGPEELLAGTDWLPEPLARLKWGTLVVAFVSRLRHLLAAQRCSYRLHLTSFPTVTS